MRVGELLIPIAEAMRRDLLGGSYIQADETTVDVQMHDGRGKTIRPYFWQYGRPGGGAVFEFRLGGGETAQGIPGTIRRHLQTDGYVPMMAWAGRRWCMPAAGRTREGSSSRHQAQSQRRGGHAHGGADRRPVRESTPRRANRTSTTPRAMRCVWSGPAIGGDHPRGGRGSPRRLPTFQRVGEGGELLALALAEAHALPGVSRVGVEQQPGRDSMRPVALGRRTGIHVGSQQAGPKVRHSVHRGKLPPAEDSDPGIPGWRPARLG